MLNPRQRQILRYLQQYIPTHGRAPSLKEIAQAIGLNTVSTVHTHLNILEQAGYISRPPGNKRNILLQRQPANPDPLGTPIPLTGYLKAGHPLQTLTDTIQLTTPLTTASQPLFAIKIADDSYQADLLLSGDILIFQQTTNFQPGDTILCHITHTQTLIKKATLNGQIYHLQALHTASPPLKTKNLTIHGRLIHLLRTY